VSRGKPDRALYAVGAAVYEGATKGYHRLYLGHEFCPWLLPGLGELERARRTARERGLSFTLVTPVLREGDLTGAAKLLEGLVPDDGDEVVVNDVGLFEVMKREGWDGAVAAGRVLSRQRRGAGWRPWVPAGDKDKRFLKGSALDTPYLVEWLRDTYGVHRFEIDNLIQGVEVRALPSDVRLSVYHPYLFLSATSHCPWTFDGKRWRRGEQCPVCDGKVLELQPEEGGRKIFLAGGVIYLENDSPAIYCGRGVDRWVHQPQL
jgi:hypothetical protein